MDSSFQISKPVRNVQVPATWFGPRPLCLVGPQVVPGLPGVASVFRLSVPACRAWTPGARLLSWVGPSTWAGGAGHISWVTLLFFLSSCIFFFTPVSPVRPDSPLSSPIRSLAGVQNNGSPKKRPVHPVEDLSGQHVSSHWVMSTPLPGSPLLSIHQAFIEYLENLLPDQHKGYFFE